MKLMQRRNLYALLDLLENKVITRLDFSKGVEAIFETIEAEASKKVLKRTSATTGRSLGGCTERLAAATTC